MSTATLPPPNLNDAKRADLHRKVCDPLERLRGYIRLYVTIEGAAVLLVYLSLWFWIGLILDYGFFKAFTVDWVEVFESARSLRVGMLVILVSGLLAVVAVKVLLRLTREFRNAALALVLERRFPQILGDRLITAVELADPKAGEKYGYSQVMIDLTIQDAARAVDQIPVNEAFNWKRLQRYGLVVAGLTVGCYVLAFLGYALYGSIAKQPAGFGTFFQHFNNVASIWFERNIALRDTIWPRQAHLELVGFPTDGNLKVGKNVDSVPVRVRAVKWVYADPKVRGGWRALTWNDVQNDRRLLNSVPTLPAGWDPNMTVDQIEVRLDKEAGQLDGDTVIALRNTLHDKLALRAKDIAMQRRIRVLELPETVGVTYDGQKTSGDIPLTPDAGNEFSGNFTGLKETVRFKAVAKDFRTLPSRIILVPPPALAELYRVEAQPAYLYHRPPLDGSLKDLKGLKQVLPRERVYLGDENTSIGVPAGTDLTLSGLVDKERDKADQDLPLLKSVTILPRRDKTKAGDQLAKLPVKIVGEDAKRFEVTFANVSERLDFDFEFLDTDNVSSRRHVIIEPKVDTAPEVEVFLDVVRKTSQGFMITPIAMVPFSGPARDERGQEKFHGRVRDDHGLSQLRYHFSYSLVENAGAVRARAVLAALAAHLTPTQGPAGLAAAAPFLGYVGHLVEPTTAEPDRVDLASLGTFAEEVKKRDRFDLTKAQLALKLQQPLPAQYQDRQRGPLVPDFTVDSDREVFDLQRHLPQLRASGENAQQPRYRLRLWVEASDNNVETGPRVGESKERFTLLVVSEHELLAEIAKEQTGLFLKLEQLQSRLRDSRTKLQQVTQELEDPKLDEKTYSPLATRVLEIADTIGAGAITAREVFTDYRRIVREEETNRVSNQKIQKDSAIAQLLDLALRGEFLKAEDSERNLQQNLEKKQNDKKLADQAKATLDQLIERLQEVLDQMGQIEGINSLIVKLRAIEEEQRDNVAILKYLKARIEEDLLKDLLDPEPKKP
ncbi:MAG: hypothetical protein JNM56_32675 [Planctomycetia bacterium]|nr:hypothetical protein [Planctomycetia bacterium]